MIIFDADERVILFNRRFREIYPIASETLRPGRLYGDALAESVARGQFDIPENEREAWLADRLANFRNPTVQHIETRLPGDRWTMVSTRRTADGGTVTSYVEITRRKRLEAALTQLSEISAAAMANSAERVMAALQVGCRYLGLPHGVVGMVDSGRLSVLFSNSPDPMLAAGNSFELAGTYSGHIVATGVALDFVDERQATVSSTPGLKRAAFIGAPLFIDGELKGVLNFSSRAPRERPFDDTERHLISVLSAWIGGNIARIREEEHRQRLEQNLIRMATTDELTGISNRRSFLENSAHAVRTARRYGRPLSLIVADIDHFKSVNDTHGHAIGDEALRFFAETVGAQLREVDLFGRLGGEEFAIMMPETDAAGAFAAAERVGEALRSSSLPAGERTLRLTASFGVVGMSQQGGDVAALLHEADIALYEAKRTGRDRVVAR